MDVVAQFANPAFRRPSCLPRQSIGEAYHATFMCYNEHDVRYQALDRLEAAKIWPLTVRFRCSGPFHQNTFSNEKASKWLASSMC